MGRTVLTCWVSCSQPTVITRLRFLASFCLPFASLCAGLISLHLREFSCCLPEAKVSSVWAASVRDCVKFHFLFIAFCISARLFVVWMRCSRIRSSQAVPNSHSLAFSRRRAAYTIAVSPCVGFIFRNRYLA